MEPQIPTFCALAALITITPGADTMLVLRNTLRGGRRDGFVTAVGICSRARGPRPAPRDDGPMMRATALVLALLAILAPGTRASAQTYVLARETFSSGVRTAAGASFRIGTTLGEAGIVGSTSDDARQLVQGFWWPQAAIPVGVETFTPFALPARHALRPPAPNPFRSGARLTFDVASAGSVALDVFDVSGRRVRRLVNEPLAAGRHRVTWDGRDDVGRELASGVFYARFAVGDFVAVRRLLLLR